MKRLVILAALAALAAAALVGARVTPAHAAGACDTIASAPFAIGGSSASAGWSNTDQLEGQCAGVGTGWFAVVKLQHRLGTGAWISEPSQPTSGSDRNPTGSGFNPDNTLKDWPSHPVWFDLAHDGVTLSTVCKFDWRGFVTYKDQNSVLINTDHTPIQSATC